MSSKGLTTKKTEREVMVTRCKSAQMKRQLRVKDRSMKHLTDLLKSPTKETQPVKNVPVKKRSPKAKQCLLKSVEKIQNLPQKTFKLSKVLRKEILLVQDEEYYPNKRKREMKVNKVLLKPKTKMKVVGEISGSIKRKYAVPLKASDKAVPVHPPQTLVTDSAKEKECVRLSMAEAIHLMDQQLTDEDLMEILTCPSPVWWEDPPDEHYIEDAIFTRSPPASEKVPVAPSPPAPMDIDPQITNDTHKIITIPNLSTKSDKFLKKRSKLEDVLGNIKDKNINNKTNNKMIPKTSNKDVLGNIKDQNINNKTNNKMITKTSNKDVLGNIKDQNINKKTNNKMNTKTNNKDVLGNIKDQNINKKTNNKMITKTSIKDVLGNIKDKNINNTTNDKKIIKTSNKDAAICANISTNNNKIDEAKNSDKSETNLAESDDEIVLHNTSMDDDDLLKDLENMDIPIANDVIVIVDDDDFIEKTSEEVRQCKKEDDVIIYNKEIKVETNLKEELPKNAPALVLTEQIASPKSLDSFSSKSSSQCSMASGKDVDTISDTNVRFLLEEDDSKNKMEQVESNKLNEPTADNLDDSITVYKIIEEISDTTDTKEINEKHSNEILNIVDAKLNDYFKKCKKVYQKKMKYDKDINKNDKTKEDYLTISCDRCKPTFKRVPENENVKYCLKCSSIFDSKDCTYCIKKTNKACAACKIKFCCENYFKVHDAKCSELRTICLENFSEKVDDVDTKMRVLSCPVSL